MGKKNRYIDRSPPLRQSPRQAAWLQRTKEASLDRQAPKAHGGRVYHRSANTKTLALFLTLMLVGQVAADTCQSIQLRQTEQLKLSAHKATANTANANAVSIPGTPNPDAVVTAMGGTVTAVPPIGTIQNMIQTTKNIDPLDVGEGLLESTKLGLGKGAVPTSDGVTVHHRWVARGEVTKLKTTGLSPTEINEPPLPEVSPSMIEDCFVDGHSLLEGIDISAVKFPLQVAQVQCNTAFEMADGTLVKIPGIEAKEVISKLTQKKQGVLSTADKTDSLLTIYPGPAHAMVSLSCTHCSKGGPYYNTVGGYPGELKPDAFILNDASGTEVEKMASEVYKLQTTIESKMDSLDPFGLIGTITRSITKPLQSLYELYLPKELVLKHDGNGQRYARNHAQLQITVPLTDQQAAYVMAYLNGIQQACEESSEECTYRLLSHNCFDVAQNAMKAAGFESRIIELLGDEQLPESLPKLSGKDLLHPSEAVEEVWRKKALLYAYAKVKGLQPYIAIARSRGHDSLAYLLTLANGFSTQSS